MSVPKYYLRVHQVEQHCLFDLSWGSEQRLPVAKLPFPAALATAAQSWRAAYLHHYESLATNSPPPPPSDLRGQVVSQGSTRSAVNSHSALVKAEQRLLLEFHNWLRQPELYELRQEIARASRALESSQPIQLFLTCDPIDLARLPWETWEISTEDVLTGPIQILRMPVSLRSGATPSVKLRPRPRILAILGDDRHLDLKVDQDIMASLKPVAEVQFIRRESHESIADLKQRIVQTITDETGWDMLFFAGHSSETDLTGGELEIAPHASIQISEIIAQLKIAQQRGLRVAVFNSCEGLSFANSLIDLGLDQVMVMRERVHNRVAQEFLLHFCQKLAQHQTVQQATIAACQFLKAEKSLTYPSGYLLPSLFCRPEAAPFQIPPKSWSTWFQRFKPKRHEAIAVAGLAILSLLPPVQDFLLDRRILAQAIYRQMVQPQPSTATETTTEMALPPTLLVRIDDESISRDKVKQIQPIDHGYLARLVKQLHQQNAKVIGIDYLLDYYQEDGAPALASAIGEAGKTTKFVLATDYEDNWTDPRPEFRNAAWTVLGTIQAYPLYSMVLYPQDSRQPFPFWLAWLHQCCLSSGSPSFDLVNQMATGTVDPRSTNLVTNRMQAFWLTQLSEMLNQKWFHPIMDYSVPLQQVYTEIPAWKLLENPDAPELANLQEQVVIIIAGNYAADADGLGVDGFTAPLAIRYWYMQRNAQDESRAMVGGEYHAYMVHQTLNQRWVIPVPDLAMVLLAGVLGKATQLWYKRGVQPSKIRPIGRRTKFLLALWGGSVLYSMLSLQIYLTCAVLIPVILPVGVYCLFIAPIVVSRKS